MSVPIDGSRVNFVACTSSQYQSILSSNQVDPNTVYFISDSLDIKVGTDNYTDTTSLSSRVSSLETWRDSIQDGDNLSYGG